MSVPDHRPSDHGLLHVRTNHTNNTDAAAATETRHAWCHRFEFMLVVTNGCACACDAGIAATRQIVEASDVWHDGPSRTRGLRMRHSRSLTVDTLVVLQIASVYVKAVSSTRSCRWVLRVEDRQTRAANRSEKESVSESKQ